MSRLKKTVTIWPAITLIWLPLFIYLLTAGQGGLVFFNWDVLTISYAWLRWGVVLSWLMTGLVSMFVIMPEFLEAKEKPVQVEPVEVVPQSKSIVSRVKGMAGNVAGDLISDGVGEALGAAGSTSVSIAIEAVSGGCLAGLLRMVIALFTGAAAVLVTYVVRQTGPDLFGTTVFCIAAVITALQWGSMWGLFLYAYLRLALIVGLIAAGIGAFGGALSGGAAGTAVLGPIGTLLGSVLGFVVGLFLSWLINRLGQNFAQGLRFVGTLFATGLLAGMSIGSLLGWQVGLGAAVLAAVLSLCLGGGVAGLSAGSLDKPRFIGLSLVFGWLMMGLLGAVNLWVIGALLFGS
jgi:hypothetical protein